MIQPDYSERPPRVMSSLSLAIGAFPTCQRPVFLILHRPLVPPGKRPSPRAWRLRCRTIWPRFPASVLWIPTILIPTPRHTPLGAWTEQRSIPPAPCTASPCCPGAFSHGSGAWKPARRLSITSVKPLLASFSLIMVPGNFPLEPEYWVQTLYLTAFQPRDPGPVT